jgi:hypothetical protein
MGKKERQAYLNAIRGRYAKAGRTEKGKILDEFCAVCGYARKYALRLLGRSPAKGLAGQARAALPFTLRGFDCDNGCEFLNWPLLAHVRQGVKLADQLLLSHDEAGREKAGGCQNRQKARPASNACATPA